VEPDEKATLLEALRVSGGNKTEAARLLGVHRMTVWNRMKKYGLRLDSQFEE
jgi:two-component system response regulator HydG